MRPQHNVTSNAKARQKKAQKRRLHRVNEHFKPFFNAALASAVVMMLRSLNVKMGKATYIFDQEYKISSIFFDRRCGARMHYHCPLE